MIELLVVIAIIAVLIGLLLPAIQKVRESANRMTCSNQIKQLGIAVHNYAGNTGKLPPAAGNVGAVYGSAHFFLLPYMEQNAIYTSANGDSINVRGVPIKEFACPSDPSAPPGGVTAAATLGYSFYAGNATTSYAVNFEILQFGSLGVTQAMPNGTTNVVLFGERYQQCDAVSGGYEALAGWAAYYSGHTYTDKVIDFDFITPVFNNPVNGGTTPYGVAYSIDDRAAPAATGSALNPTLPFQVLPTIAWSNPSSNCDYNILQTPHANVLMAGLGDGSVKAVSNSISVTTWGNACNPKNSTPLGSDW